MSTSPRLLGKYELRQRLGRGGMAEVWKAFDPQLQRFVAIKIMHADLQNDPDFMNRFLREARVVASLHHPNIVQIHDFQISRPPESDSTIAYMVMDYIEGQTLAEYIRETSSKGKFPTPGEIVRLFTSISRAVDYAHQHGMIHRDIKPANILLDKRLSVALEGTNRASTAGEPVLTDFGIAKLMGTSTGTMSGSWIGTPLYISPEQVQGYPGNERSDIYSLGVILYEICTGVRPFQGSNPSSIMMQHINATPTSPALINPNMPPVLAMVIMRCLAKDPAARFPSASMMTAAIAEAFNLPIPQGLSVPVFTGDTMDEATLYKSLQADIRNESGLYSGAISSSPVLPDIGSSSPSSSPVVGVGTPPAGAISTPPGLSPISRSGGASPSASSTPSIPGIAPDQPPAPISPTGMTPSVPPLQPPARSRRRIGLVIALLAVILVVAGASLGTFFLISHQNRTSGTPGPAGGVAFFFSSGQINLSSSQGTEDGVQISLKNIPLPTSGKIYYAWLLSDKQTSVTIATTASTPGTTTTGGTACPTTASVPSTAQPLLLGRLPVSNGTVNFSYVDQNHTNLLQRYSRFLITEENTNSTPVTPPSDQHAWRFYAEFPQSREQAGQCFSALYYMRHLLVEGSAPQGLGIYGDLDIQALRNTLKILEWAGSAKDGTDPNFIHRQVIRILDYLDGVAAVQQDAPGEPLLVDKTLAQIPLLNPQNLQTPEGESYLQRIDFQLKGLISASGVTSQVRALARSTEAALVNLQTWLEMVRTDAIQVEKAFQQFDGQVLHQPMMLTTLADMQTLANFAVVGRLDPNSNQVQPGMIQIHYSIQQFATFNVAPFNM
jgi:serine/threonine protein kinase